MASSRRSHRRIPVVLLAAFVVAVATAAGAAAQAEETGLGGKVRAGGEIVVPADETVPGDLYLAGGSIRVEGDVEGDLVAAGGQIRVLGNVGGDALLAGGEVTVSGDVAGSTRVGAGQVLLAGMTGQDAAMAAGRIRLAEGAEVGEDLLFSAGQAVMAGMIAGDVLGAAGEYRETGEVAGTTRVTLRAPEEEPTFADRVLDRVQRYVGLLVIGALLLWLAAGVMRRGAGSLRQRPLVALGAGALVLLGGVVGGVLLILVAVLLALILGLVGLGGLAALTIATGIVAVALLALGIVAATAFVAPVLVGLWLGGFLVDIGRGWVAAFGALALGTAVVVLLGSLPFVGWLVSLLVALLGLGALALGLWRRSRQQPAAPAEATVA